MEKIQFCPMSVVNYQTISTKFHFFTLVSHTKTKNISSFVDTQYNIRDGCYTYKKFDNSLQAGDR